MRSRDHGDRIWCDAVDLILYLAKNGTAWFTSEVLEEYRPVWGKPRGDPSRMVEMDPVLPINDNLYVGRDFQPGNAEIHVLVVVPRRKFNSLSGIQIDTLRRSTFSQPEMDTLREDCIHLPNWEAGIVHNVPSIWAFMKKIGGSTSFDKIFWRLEEKQVLSSILDRWREASSDESSLADMRLRSIVIGSRGIGKSMLLALMAFYIFFIYKTNVLFYRLVFLTPEPEFLSYLGYENGNAVHYVLEEGTTEEAWNVRKELNHQHGIRNCRLVMDVYSYKDVPKGFESYTLLGTKEVDIKPQDSVTQHYLLPSWSQKDLFSLGEEMYDFRSYGIKERYATSGGRVRDFTR
uniref:Crinkler (CRN) family protein putative n=1 Tax=Albugo laibachii Nc14 TaxID=890382 RepID=F0X2W1_9STRA|nr:Crinkler (CRN) family protein putative [Albugo laibachii Nc14]|eukprot:CCA28291.1 Crinkler (CRN) family protein putative [Albugo laibachii Nc14]